jgi:hypothetical protein
MLSIGSVTTKSVAYEGGRTGMSVQGELGEMDWLGIALLGFGGGVYLKAQ